MSARRESSQYAADPADLPSGTLVDLFFRAIERFGDAEALRVKRGGRWWPITYNEVLDDVRALAAALDELGVRRGERVAILSENRPEWALADYAALCHGALGVPIYATLPAKQVSYVLRDSGARVAFVSNPEQLDKVREVWEELPSLERVILFDDSRERDERVMSLGTALDVGRARSAGESAADFRSRARTASPDDVATVLYTSGTTGDPKGVMLTHNNIHSNVEAVGRLLELTPNDVSLNLLPLSHIYQRAVDYILFAHGCTTAYAESIEAVAANLVEVKPTVMAAAPRMYEKIHARVMSAKGVRRRLVLWAAAVGDRWARDTLAGRTPSPGTRLQHALADRLVFSKLRKRTGGRLRFFVSGSAPLSPDVATFFYAAGLLILEGYGLTETSPITNVNRLEDFRLGTVGKPIPGTEIKIADDGEILARGPQVMKGYFNNPEATKEAIDGDGWFHTGDVGEIDADGFLRVTDRKKDLIVTAGGKNIAPQPIENRLKTNAFVAEAVMLGDRRPYPVVLIVPDFDVLAPWASAAGIDRADEPHELVRDARVQQKMEEEVLGMVEDLARYERPKKVALLGEELTVEGGELTPTLKVKRRVVEERFRDLIKALYADPEPVAADS